MGKQISRFIVNGESYEVITEPQMTLLEMLRDQIGLTGTKCGCGTGSCGACTVLVGNQPILSCLTLALTVKEKSILTIEGMADGNMLHPIQRAFIDHGAVQCGFCTPGMILTAKALLDKNLTPTREDVMAAISGNLCRCTGYVKIIDAVLTAAETIRKGGKA